MLLQQLIQLFQRSLRVLCGNSADPYQLLGAAFQRGYHNVAGAFRRLVQYDPAGFLDGFGIG
jgi:hypothetical protein